MMTRKLETTFIKFGGKVRLRNLLLEAINRRRVRAAVMQQSGRRWMFPAHWSCKNMQQIHPLITN